MESNRHTFNLRNLMVSMACFAFACSVSLLLMRDHGSYGMFVLMVASIPPFIGASIGAGIGLLCRKLKKGLLIGLTVGSVPLLLMLFVLLPFAIVWLHDVLID